jgi:phage gp36-like protein
MPYATLTDLETRYPVELQQAGHKDATGALDTGAVNAALMAADDPINRALHTLGWVVPIAAPVPNWIVDLAVDIALYLATPTVLAGTQGDFSDRRKRYDTALSTLADMASGNVRPVPLNMGLLGQGMIAGSLDRQFSRGCL